MPEVKVGIVAAKLKHECIGAVAPLKKSADVFVATIYGTAEARQICNLNWVHLSNAVHVYCVAYWIFFGVVVQHHAPEDRIPHNWDAVNNAHGLLPLNLFLTVLYAT